MHLYSKKKSNYLALYNKIVSLTRKNFFYYDIKLVDSFETRIYLIFFHISIIFIILNIKKFDKSISQKIFDFFFSEIENNLRELGYGDTKINNEMKKVNIDYLKYLFEEYTYGEKKEKEIENELKKMGYIS